MAIMTTALIFLPIFIGLSAALTVIVADLLSPAAEAPSQPAKAEAKRRATA
jgi:hypothetical protein